MIPNAEAVIPAEAVNNNDNGGCRTSPFFYSRSRKMREIHIDCILMVHPSTQVLFKESGKAQEDIQRFRELRNKLNKTKPF